MKPPHLQALDLGNAFWRTITATTLCKLRIPDHLRDRWLTCDELAQAIAERTGRPVHTPFLCRLLRAATQLRVTQERAGRYTTTAVGRELEDREDSFRAMVMMLSDRSLNAWLQLPESIHTGEGGFNLAYGENVWELNQHDEAHATLFDKVWEYRHALCVRGYVCAVCV